MASGGEKHVIASVLKTYKMYWGCQRILNVHVLYMFEFIAANSADYDACQVYRNMALGSESHIVVSIANTYNIHVEMPVDFLNFKFYAIVGSFTLSFTLGLFIMDIYSSSRPIRDSKIRALAPVLFITLDFVHSS